MYAQNVEKQTLEGTYQQNDDEVCTTCLLLSLTILYSKWLVQSTFFALSQNDGAPNTAAAATFDGSVHGAAAATAAFKWILERFLAL